MSSEGRTALLAASRRPAGDGPGGDGEPRGGSLVVRMLRGLADLLYHYPRAFFYPQAVLFLVAVLYTVLRLEFDTNRNHLVGEDKKYHQAYLKYKRDFAAQDELVAIVESGAIEKNRQFVERLGARLERETNLFTDVFYKGDLKMMGPKALLFVTNETILVEMAQRLREAQPMLQNFAQVTNLNALFRMVIGEFRGAARNGGTEPEGLLEALPALGRIADQAADALGRPGTPPSPGITALFGGGEQAEQDLYITFASNRLYLVTARARSDALNGPAVERMRELLAETRGEVPGVNVGLTGGPVLEVDEMAQSQKDTTVAAVLALALCGLVFAFGYQETGRPVKATACLLVGLAYTFGFATLVIGHLNILTITFLPILIGLAIDFGIHLVSRYEEELRHGRTPRQAVEIAMVNTGQGIFTGCFTTAGAFLAMGFTDFDGIQEMGVISGAGLIICLVPMMTLLPVLLLRGRQNVLDQVAPPREHPGTKLEGIWLDRPWVTVGVAASVVLWAGLQLPKVWFDYNLLNLQSAGLPAVQYEHKLIEGANRSVIFGVVTASSLDEARDLQRRLEAQPSVASVDSMVPHLTEDQSRKLALIREVKAPLAKLRFAELDDSPVNLEALRQTVRALQAYLGLGVSLSLRGGEEALSDELQEVRRALRRLNDAIGGTEPEEARRKLGAFQRALLQDLQDTLAAIQQQDDRARLRPEDLPLPLRHRFVSKSGDSFLLQVNPRSNVWERANQEVFVRELREVFPTATGEPVQLYEYTSLLKDSYVEAAYYALGAVVVLVLIHFRSVFCVLLALVPVGLGTLFLAGVMGATGVPFNPANIMTLPLVVGVGVTNGIHVLNRFAEEHDPHIFGRSTGRAVLLSALTTIFGFGSLMTAEHAGIASLGLVMAVGTATCMMAGLTVLPALLRLLSRAGWSLPGKRPQRGPERTAE
ncbi:MAG: MMPL family transporter [Verrucomicrobiales bacterium]|nr:MMPL family transporter [Verrucomicrobiales bacterium]